LRLKMRVIDTPWALLLYTGFPFCPRHEASVHSIAFLRSPAFGFFYLPECFD
jgi:hypothetical protein